MNYGDKTGQCECCDKGNIPIQYSGYVQEWLCESCWDGIAENVMNTM